MQSYSKPTAFNTSCKRSLLSTDLYVSSISSAAAAWPRNYVGYLGCFNVNNRMPQDIDLCLWSGGCWRRPETDTFEMAFNWWLLSALTGLICHKKICTCNNIIGSYVYISLENQQETHSWTKIFLKTCFLEFLIISKDMTLKKIT